MQIKNRGLALLRWVDSEAQHTEAQDIKEEDTVSNAEQRHIDWFRCIPFLILHLGCLGAFWVGYSTTALIVCLASFWLRMFAITAFYHRYFSHRSFKANRFWQFVFAVLGNTAAQRGPLWWAAHHRLHHKHSDQAKDPHSPITQGFLWGHMGWFMSKIAYPTQYAVIKDLAKFPELRFLNRFDALVPILFACALFFTGTLVDYRYPQLETSGAQWLVWGFFISTVFVFHATCTINSLAHTWGSRRFKTKDHSRNNFFLALLTLGEGWHNNHHRYPASTRQGFYWHEIDIAHAMLKLMSWLRIVGQLNPVPVRVLNEGKANRTKSPKPKP